MDTFFNFALGYIFFWTVPFVFIGAILLKIQKIEKKLNDLNS